MSVYSGKTSPKRTAFLNRLPAEARRRLKLLTNLGRAIIISAIFLTIYGCLFLHPVGAVVKLLHTGPDSLFLVTVESWILGFPYMIIGLAVMIALVCNLDRLLIPLAGSYAAEWNQYTALEHSSGPSSGSFGVVVLTTLACVVAILLMALDAYMVVSRDGVTVNHFWGVGASKYNWSQVESVQRIGGGCPSRYRIVFSDGNDWTSGESRRNSVRIAAEYIASTTGKDIEYVYK